MNLDQAPPLLMTTTNSIRSSIIIAASFAAVIIGLKLIETLLGLDLYQYGVYPRSQQGLIGILVAPLIHGSWQHVLANTLPTVFLGSLLIYGYPSSRWWALAGIWLLSGLGVWLFARSSYHVGASGIAHGMFFYLFIGGFLRRDKRSAALLMLAFYLYGGMLLTIFPRDPRVSFESHLFGALAGALCAFAFRHWDPKPPRKRYSWEDEPDEDEEDYPPGDISEDREKPERTIQ
jgi:membrane associated rhomboid family serine protease